MYKKIFYTFSIIFSVLFCCQGVEPSFQATFDKDFNGDIGNNGKVKTELRGAPQIVPGGISGNAMLSGPESGYIDVPTKNILSPDSGTIMMWVKPLDWELSDGKFHVFAETQSNNDWLILYKYQNSVGITALTSNILDGRLHAICFVPDSWKKGEWKHIAMTWDQNGTAVYVDGKRNDVSPVPGPLPGKFAPFIAIGDRQWSLPRKTASLIDDVKFYKTALSRQEIREEFQKVKFKGSVPLSAETGMFFLEPDPDNSTIRFCYSTDGADSTGLEAVFSWLGPDAKTFRVPVKDGSAQAAIPYPDPGKCTAKAEIFRNGKRLFELNRSFVMPDLSWRGNSIGLQRKILPSYTPLTMKGKTVSCFGRTYSFEKSILPDSLISRGKELLASGVTFRATVNGKPIVWKTSDVRVLSVDEFGATLEGTLKSGRITLNVSATIEYDGFIEYNIQGCSGAALDSLSLEIPLNIAHARYFHRNAPFFAVTKSIPAKLGVVERTKFEPYYWIGDNDRGLFWCCDTDRGWPNGDSPDTCEIIREKDRVLFRVTVLKPGQKLAPDWDFRFALQATPVKQLSPTNGREYRNFFVAGKRAKTANATNRTLWYNIWTNPARNAYFGYPEEKAGFDYNAWIAKCSNKGCMTQNYIAIGCHPSNSPEFQLFKRKWIMGYCDSAASDVRSFKCDAYAAAPYGDRDYADFTTWKIREYFRKFKFDGIYNDNTFPYDSYNPKTPYGYLRNGHARRSFSIFDGRKLYRRVMTMLTDERPVSFNECHMSNKVVIPIIQYHDFFLNGENVVHKMKGDSYPDTIPLDVFRVEYTGRPWGVSPRFLVLFKGDAAKRVEPTRELMGMLMIHDVNIAVAGPQCCNVAEVEKALDLLDEFGYVHAEFIPYFAEECPVKISGMDKVYASAYKLDGKCLIVAANLGKTPAKGRMTVDPSKLGFSSMRFTDFITKKDIPNPAQEFSVPARDYRMILIEKTNEQSSHTDVKN